MHKNDKLSFWNERALKSEYPGSDDFILKEIEKKFILNYLRNNIRILDIGCGDGSTLLQIKNNFNIEGVGIDFSKEMINKASKKAEDLKFYVSSVLSLPEDLGDFDIIYTQRCLINLNSFEEQAEAIEKIRCLLRPNGLFIMVESTIDGLNKTNILRKMINLDEILPPWHNTFFHVEKVYNLQTNDFRIIEFHHISSMYHFLSRVVYAGIASEKNEPLRYDSDINKLAANLPQDIGEFGPVKGWIWQKLA